MLSEQVQTCFGPSVSCDTRPRCSERLGPESMGPFHYQDADQFEHGPFGLQQLQKLFAAKTLTESTQIFCNSAALQVHGWRALETLPKLLEALTSTSDKRAVTVCTERVLSESASSLEERLEQLSEHFVSVERRFSDFEWLHKALAAQISEKALPQWPSEVRLARNNEEFRNKRREQLESYINGLLILPKLQRNDLLKAWLTTQKYAPLKLNRSAPQSLVSAINTYEAVPLFLCHALEATLLDRYIAKLETHLKDHASRMKHFAQRSAQLDNQAWGQEHRLDVVKNEEPLVEQRTFRCKARAAQEHLWLNEQQEKEQMVCFVRGDMRDQHTVEQQAVAYVDCCDAVVVLLLLCCCCRCCAVVVVAAAVLLLWWCFEKKLCVG